MSNWKIKISLFLNYFVFAILLNSVGAVILQVQRNYSVLESSASILEAFKDLSIAGVSFFVGSYVARIGYKNSMLIALAFIAAVCLLMPSLGSFAMTKFLFAATGTSFALIKVSVYATIGIVTDDKKQHASFMNFIESFFMIGILTGNFIFGAFVDDQNPQSTQWLNVYYILAGISTVAFLLLATATLDESSTRTTKTKPLVEDFKDMFILSIKPLVLVFIVSAFTYVLIEQSIMSWLPTFNNKVLSLPATLSIQMASILAAATAFGRFTAGLTLRKIHWFNVVVFCLLSAIILVLIAIPLARSGSGSAVTSWSNAPLGAFVFPFIGIFLAPIYPAINSAVLSTLPPRQHGPMAGLIVIFSALGGTTGSIITGNIFQSYGGQTAFYFSLVPITILLICLFFFNRLQKKTETAQAGLNLSTAHSAQVVGLQVHELGSLFEEVQMKNILGDGKTFPDCIPKRAMEEIQQSYQIEKEASDFNLKSFVDANFIMPKEYSTGYRSDLSKSVSQHIEILWPILTRTPQPEAGSLIPLPNPYIVPGGRFREIYYWDSYFTMLGLKVSKKISLIENMIDNFSFLINTIGYIPNGNRTYFIGRSQPPFFSSMIKLLREGTSQEESKRILLKYLPALEKEHQFWMGGAGTLTASHVCESRVVRMADGSTLNRYWDFNSSPRPESFREDVELSHQSEQSPEELFRNIRAAAESGWDFSSRWFRDVHAFGSIHTTEIIPVDLNCLLMHLEETIAEGYKVAGDLRKASEFSQRAAKRRAAVIHYCWNEEKKFFFDFDFVLNKQKENYTLAASFPLFFNIASPLQAASVGNILNEKFLKPCGLATTLEKTAEQWDSPNGWAPLQWISYRGCTNYGLTELAENIRRNWIATNTKIYNDTGKMTEKYNVFVDNVEASGGEYPNQDGFGWTNGVFLAMANEN